MKKNDLVPKKVITAIFENKKIYHAIFWTAVLTFSLLLVIEFFNKKHYFAGTDGLYYFSIAKNLHENGVFRDLVTGGLVFTPQNATVFIMYILLKLGFGRESVFMATTIINYIALLTAIFPLMTIIRIIGIKSRIAAYSLIAYCLCYWPFLAVILYAQNEGLFFSAAIWLIFLLIRIHQFNYAEITFEKKTYQIYLALCFILSAAAIHLRLSLIFVAFGGIAASLLCKRFKTVLLMSILSIVMLVSLFIPYCFIETDISEYSEGKIYYIFSDFKGTVFDFCFKAVPASIFHSFQNIRFNVLYLPVLLSLLTALIISVRQRKYLKLQILFVCFMTYGLVLVYGTFNPRFLIIIMPLIFIVMVDSKHFRNIAYLFIFACISTSLWAYYDGIERWDAVDFWSHVNKNVKFEKENTVMISGNPRMCWFFTDLSPEFPQQQWRQWDVYLPRDKRHGSVEYGHVELYKWEDIKTGKPVYLAGHKLFVDFQIGRIKQIASENAHTADFKIIESYKDYKLTRVFITSGK